MRILFVHQNFPGQFLHIARELARDPENEIVALTMGSSVVPGVRSIRYNPLIGSSKTIHFLASDFESKVIRGESAARAALLLKREGFQPDLIYGHPGWGETLFLKEVWPQASLLSFAEFYYATKGADVGFDPEYPSNFSGNLKVRSKNAAVHLALAESDWLISPTKWQAEQVPRLYHNRLSVIHDGIDTDAVRPNANAKITLGKSQIVLKPGDEVVTFVNRNLEPYRGFHTFMRSLPKILAKRPGARVILVGGDGVSYGSALPDAQTFRSKYLNEISGKIDLSRVHFVGQVDYALFLTLLQISAVHVYLTYPFVLSWSMLEAMSAGCLVVGSATRPVQEVITNKENGLLVDFFSPTEIADAVVDVLADRNAFDRMKAAARETILEKYDLRSVCLPQQIKLIKSII